MVGHSGDSAWVLYLQPGKTHTPKKVAGHHGGHSGCLRGHGCHRLGVYNLSWFFRDMTHAPEPHATLYPNHAFFG